MSSDSTNSILFFRSPGEFRKWLASNHDRLDEQWVGFYKKDSGRPSITWPESVDEALCFGWIDGLRKSIDGVSYRIRFTPRRPRSHWSRRNLHRMSELLAEGRVESPGLEVYEGRNLGREGQASYEQQPVELPEEYRAHIETVPDAWAYFQAAAPSYRKQVSWWVVSAKREETRRRRLGILIESCAAGEVIPPLRWSVRKGGK
ncbi:MAG: bacteriocin-protection protein [Gemmatimonadetes bacterium]|nr:bacteriocin-protection protein [Gemmatimonadota bacterium]